MGKKIYAVKNGRKTGLFNTWEECEAQTKGYSGALYKAFTSISEAKAYLGSDTALREDEKADVIAYVDGSYDDAQKLFSYGIVMIIDDNEIRLSERFDESEKDMIEMHNVAGEIAAARKAMEYCVKNGYSTLDIYHDYEGIAKWCTGDWTPSKPKTIEYKEYFDSIKDKLSISFFKVTGHSGDKYNEIADALAKNAIAGIELKEENISKINVYVDRDNFEELLTECGIELWQDKFEKDSFSQNGTAERLVYRVSGNTYQIDVFFKADGSATIKGVGSNNIYNSLFLNKLGTKCFKNKHENAHCTFNRISDDVFNKITDYLNQNEKVTLLLEEQVVNPEHKLLKYKSAFGDKITIKRFANNTVTFQGNPAYLFSQLMYIMSMQDEVTEEEINEKQKEVYKATITVDEARNILKDRLPNAYDKLEEGFKKMISPSISLSNSQIEVEEYSCYVFPLLKGLEALLLKLLLNKSIIINPNAVKGNGEHKNFSEIFEPSVPGNKTSRFVVKSNISTNISDSTYVNCLEDLYNYLKQSRHVYFHANQILMMTRMIFDKSEADAILNDTLELIDEVAKKVL